MQRLHLNDLTGVLLQGSEEWKVLTLKAIADEDENVQIGDSRFYSRRVGEVLHEEREPLTLLEPIREVLESDESDVIRCWAPDSRRSAPCGHSIIAAPRTAGACVIQAI
jgi:hypothetical protein